MASSNIVVAFDAYGTLLSTESIAKKLTESFGEDQAKTIAAEWRKYQLEYTWRSNSMNQYIDFATITRRSLLHAVTEQGKSIPHSQVESLMESYDSLSTFPDVSPCLSSLASVPSITAVVFSNGTYDMVSASVTRSPDLSPHASAFQQIVVVEDVRRFKPDPRVYEHLARKVGKEGRMEEVWLVSGNPFDVVGANACGMKTCWVDRAGNGWADRLVALDVGRPTVIVTSLEDVVDAVKSLQVVVYR
ncbi:haloacid dehalogenase, type II [Aulographum hederae CBS 113979]|uniref:Haloacid dehalogenase, type II n=1 Tax=Aulographum hederae CBS 113979 TaxID=1176131 RepID=A0A6G1H3G5_9PEZI|nr:haloacid dehalogenase, type II [Aulographum hederae CBS 113979]